MNVPDAKLFKLLGDLQDVIRSGPPITSTMRSELGGLSGQAVEEGHRTVALLLLFLGQAIDPLCQAEHVANTIDGAVAFMPEDSADARFLRLAAAVLHGSVSDGT